MKLLAQPCRQLFRLVGVFAYMSPTFRRKRRKLDLRVLEWQRKYREQAARTIDGAPLFAEHM